MGIEMPSAKHSTVKYLLTMLDRRFAAISDPGISKAERKRRQLEYAAAFNVVNAAITDAFTNKITLYVGKDGNHWYC